MFSSEGIPTEVVTAISVDGNTIGNWLINNVVYVGIVIVAIVIITAAVTKKPRDAMLAFGICLVALLLVSLATYRVELGDWIRVTFFGG